MKKLGSFGGMLVILLAGCAVWAQTFADSTSPDETLAWNDTLLDALFTAGTNPPTALRCAAIMNTAIFDAYNGVERRYTPIHEHQFAPRGASRRAAIIGAAYTTLSQLFPSQQAKFDTARDASLAALTDDEDESGDGHSVELGLAWGTTVAEDILAWRATDGFTATFPPFTGGTALGQWRPTPPAFAPMVLQQFAFMTTFVVPSRTTFRAPFPRGLQSQAWVDDYNEVKRIASLMGSPRTTDQTNLAFFWARVGWAHWSEAAHQMAVANQTTRSDNARLFALLSLAGADTIITTWSAKRDYAADPTAVTWRPITAIRLGGDGNPNTPADPAWTPLIVTQPHPEYVAAHPSVNGALARLLSSYFGDGQSFTVTYPVQPSPAFGALPPGSPSARSYTSISGAESDANNARIYGGLHYRSSVNAAAAEGRAITDYVLAHVAQPLQGTLTGQIRHDHSDGDCLGDGESANDGVDVR